MNIKTMWKRIYLVLFLYSMLSVYNTECAMTEAQLKAAGKLVRNACQPKNKVSDAEIDGMHKGSWDDLSRAAMCYMYCVLAMNRMITKENILAYDLVMGMIEKSLPLPRKADTINAVKKCKDSAKTTDDKCVAGYELSRCFYEAKPENYFLP